MDFISVDLIITFEIHVIMTCAATSLAFNKILESFMDEKIKTIQ